MCLFFSITTIYKTLPLYYAKIRHQRLYDLDIMRSQFDMITHNEWDEYIEVATAHDFHYKKINVLKSASKKRVSLNI
ncbi:MAG: hypothetical protein R2728_14315 [Chitinophagales bacterium]